MYQIQAPVGPDRQILPPVFFQSFVHHLKTSRTPPKVTPPVFLQRIIGTRKLRCHMDGTWKMVVSLTPAETKIPSFVEVPKFETKVGFSAARKLNQQNIEIMKLSGLGEVHLWTHVVICCQKKRWQCWDDKKWLVKQCGLPKRQHPRIG